MPKFLLQVLVLALFQGCLDFEIARVATDKGTNFPPSIDKKYVSPPPSAFLRKVPIASNCKPLEFKIPPIRDFNKDDKLYYLWFFNGILLPPYQGVIEPENRDRAIVTLTLDKQKIEDALGRSHLEPSFFETSHVLEFVVGDRPYAIPSSRFFDDPTAHEDSIHWSIWFTDTPCSL
jgi:hypothetical protein